MPLNLQVDGQLEAVFETIKDKWGKLDICLHSIAFAPKEDLQGRVVDCSKAWLSARHGDFVLVVHPHGEARRALDEGWRHAIDHDLLRVANGRRALQHDGASKGGAWKSATRYLAAELGPKGIRVHAISPGPLKTRAASGITDFDELISKAQTKAPARSLVSIDDVGVAVAFLSMNGAKLITGETLYIDGGYHIID